MKIEKKTVLYVDKNELLTGSKSKYLKKENLEKAFPSLRREINNYQYYFNTEVRPNEKRKLGQDLIWLKKGMDQLSTTYNDGSYVQITKFLKNHPTIDKLKVVNLSKKFSQGDYLLEINKRPTLLIETKNSFLSVLDLINNRVYFNNIIETYTKCKLEKIDYTLIVMRPKNDELWKSFFSNNNILYSEWNKIWRALKSMMTCRYCYCNDNIYSESPSVFNLGRQYSLLEIRANYLTGLFSEAIKKS